MATENKITVKFEAKGAKQLIAAIETLGLAQIKLEKGTKAYEKALKKLNKNSILGVRNFRNLGAESSIFSKKLSVLRSKLLIISFGIMLVQKSIGKLVSAYAEQELADKKLQAAITSTASAAKLTLGQLKGMASGLQEVTSFGDEAIQTSQGLMLTFTKIGRSIMPQAVEMVLNMSTAMGTDLKSSTIQLGKALNDPIAGISALSRVGVQLTAEQKKSIKSFMGVGNVLEAQKVILGELETQFGGLARAAGTTIAGSMDKMGNAMGDAAEKMGAALAPMVIKIAEGLTIAAEAAGAFFRAMTETEVEKVLRELNELGVNTLEIEQKFAEAKVQSSQAAITGLESEKSLRDKVNALNEDDIELLKLQAAEQLKLRKLKEKGNAMDARISELQKQFLEATMNGEVIRAANLTEQILKKRKALAQEKALVKEVGGVESRRINEQLAANKEQKLALLDILKVHDLHNLSKLELKRILTEIDNLAKGGTDPKRTLGQINSDEKLAIAKINLKHAPGELTLAEKNKQILDEKGKNLAEIKLNDLELDNDAELRSIAIKNEKIKAIRAEFTADMKSLEGANQLAVARGEMSKLVAMKAEQERKLIDLAKQLQEETISEADAIKVMNDVRLENIAITREEVALTRDRVDRINELAVARGELSKLDAMEAGLKQERIDLDHLIAEGAIDIAEKMEREHALKLKGIDLEKLRQSEALKTAEVIIGSMQQVTDALVSNLDKRQQVAIQSLKEETKYINASDNQKIKMEEEVNKKYQQQRNNIFYAEKALALAQIFIDTKRGIMHETGKGGVFGLTVLGSVIAAAGVTSAALVAAQQPPQYEYGGMVGGRSHSAGGTLIEAEQGEFVMNRNAVDSIGVGALNAMNQGGGGVTVNVSGNVLTQDFVEGELAESIQEAVRKGVSFA